MYKTWTKTFFKFLFFICISIISFIYVIDPYQHYRISSWYDIMDDEKQRDITPGIAKNAFYESAIIGSSMAENFSPYQMDKLFDTKSVKLCISGITAYEINELLQTTFNSNPNLKNIILALDATSLSGEIKRSRNSELPLYLYDNNYFNDIKYLLNLDTFKDSIKMLENRGKSKNDLDTLWYWKDRYTFSKDITEDSYAQHLQKPFNDLDNFSLKNMKDNFNTNILPFIKKYPNTKFYIFYPPYSYLTYKLFAKQQWLNNFLNFKKYVYDVTLAHNNTKIFDFQCDLNITKNLNLYRDISHYSANINSYILESIYKNNFLTTSSNLEKCSNTIKDSFEDDITKSFHK